MWSEGWGCHFPESPSQDGSGLELANKALEGHVIRGRETEPLFSRGTAADRCADVRLEAVPRWASGGAPTSRLQAEVAHGSFPVASR